MVAMFFIVYFLIAGMSATARKRKEEVAQALKKLIQAKGKMPAMKYQQLLEDLRGQSETVNSSFCLSLYCIIFLLQLNQCRELLILISTTSKL